MPKLTGAETKAKAWELIYKDGTTLKGNHPPKTVARTPGTHLPGHSLTHSSLLHLPPPQVQPPQSHLPSNMSPKVPRWLWKSLAKRGSTPEGASFLLNR